MCNTNLKYLGTYPVRTIGRNAEQGIHIPTGITGTYSIYSEDNGKIIRMVKQE